MLAMIEEVVGVDAVGDGAANEGDPVEDKRRLVLVHEQHLRQDVEEDRGSGQNPNTEQGDVGGRVLRQLVGQWPDDRLYEPHGG